MEISEGDLIGFCVKNGLNVGAGVSSTKKVPSSLDAVLPSPVVRATVEFMAFALLSTESINIYFAVGFEVDTSVGCLVGLAMTGFRLAGTLGLPVTGMGVGFAMDWLVVPSVMGSGVG